jgi:mRNA-degrading endonuclease toxin of MazEF toxin-antitoxin module
VPLAAAELQRGRIVFALFPFSCNFPRTVEHGGERLEVATIEDYARLRRGRPTGVATEVRLRPVLLLHDGTRGDHGDIACLRVNTVKPSHRRSDATWRRIESHEHPLFFHLPKGRPYGLEAESVISLSSVGTVNKSAVLGPRHLGRLNAHEMQIVSERLAATLSLDLSPRVAERAREALRRAGAGE